MKIQRAVKFFSSRLRPGILTAIPFLLTVLLMICAPATLAEDPPPVGTETKTNTYADGSTRSVTTMPDGTRTVAETGKSGEVTRSSITFDKDGNVTSETRVHKDGTTDTSTYDPKTGVRDSTTVRPDGGRTRMVSQKDGSSVITQTGFNPNIVVTAEDAKGHVEETTTRPDGTKTVRGYTRLPKRGPDEYGPDTRPTSETTTEYNAAGKPTRSVTTTNEPYGRGVRQTRREVTEYDGRGKPASTTITAPAGRWGSTIKIEEVQYHANGFRKIIQRFDKDGKVTETYYYDNLGKLIRSAIRPGHKAGAAPTSGTWFVPKNKSAASVTTPLGDKVPAKKTKFGDDIERSLDQDAFNAPGTGHFFKDSRPIDGRAIEALGNFNPNTKVDEHYKD